MLCYCWVVVPDMDVPWLLNHASTERYLSYFQCKTPLTKAAMNICVQGFFCEHKILFLQEECPKIPLLSRMVVAYLVFRKLPQCFPECLYHFTFPAAMHESSTALFQILKTVNASITSGKKNNATTSILSRYLKYYFNTFYGKKILFNATFKNSNRNRNKYNHINIYRVYMYTCTHIHTCRMGKLTKI